MRDEIWTSDNGGFLCCTHFPTTDTEFNDVGRRGKDVVMLGSIAFYYGMS